MRGDDAVAAAGEPAGDARRGGLVLHRSVAGGLGGPPDLVEGLHGGGSREARGSEGVDGAGAPLLEPCPLAVPLSEVSRRSGHSSAAKYAGTRSPTQLTRVRVRTCPRRLLQWLIEKEQERIRREAEQADMIGAVTRWLEELRLADKEEMVREYIGETGGTADLARLDDDDLKDLMIDLELDKDEKEAFRAAVMELNVDD